jgi:hypothetical protein
MIESIFNVNASDRNLFNTQSALTAFFAIYDKNGHVPNTDGLPVTVKEAWNTYKEIVANPLLKLAAEHKVNLVPEDFANAVSLIHDAYKDFTLPAGNTIPKL